MKINLDALARDAAAVYAETYKDRDGHPREPAADSSQHIHNAIWVAVAGLLRNTDIQQATFSGSIYRELVRAVTHYVAMIPLRDPDGTVYEHFFMPKDIPEPDSYDFNRLWEHLLEQEFLWLLDALNHTRTQRHLLLVQLFAHWEPDATSPVLAHLELIDREMVNLRERITSFCAEHPQLRNPLIPPPDTSRDEPTFKQAIGYDQRKHDFLEIFQPSPPEEILLPDLPDFREREWHLFHFTFSSDTPSSDNNREDICMNGDQVFDEDIRLLHHRLIERKMLLAYTILVQMIHETREIGFRVEQNIWYLPFQALCDDIHRLRVAHLRATIWEDDEDDEEQLLPSWIEAELWEEYAEIADIQWVLEWCQTQLSHLDSLSVLVSETYSLATQFVEGYEWILEDETSSSQQKQAQVATLRASLKTKFKVCLQLLSQQEDDRAEELQDDPLFDRITRTIDTLSRYLHTDGHISE
jgi:hypothetical protein